MSIPRAFPKELEAVELGYYKPKESSHPENRILVSIEHYLLVKGPVKVFGKKTEDFLKAEIIQKDEREGYWDCFAFGSGLGENISLAQLSFYEKVKAVDLPWNNGEKWYSETMWAGIEVQRILRRFLH